MDNKLIGQIEVDYAPGMRLIIRDEEWVVKKAETNSLGHKTLHCIGISPLVKDHDSMFLTDIEDIEQVDMDAGKVAHTGQLFKTSLEKSLFSSPAACAKSIDERLKKLCKNYAALETNHSPDRWWENAPTRVEPGKSRMPKKQVYHFLMGDPGMANYTDKVIKSLSPNEIKTIKGWNKNFIKPYSKGDIETILRISGIIDTLWAKQIELQKEVEKQTADALAVYGHPAGAESSHTTIREKDFIFEKLYRTEGGDNASPYARLKFAMDY
jgi:hypothetical protein